MRAFAIKGPDGEWMLGTVRKEMSYTWAALGWGAAKAEKLGYRCVEVEFREVGEAAEQPADPAMVMVPREPTDEMRQAGMQANMEHEERYPKDGILRTIRIYRAMLSATKERDDKGE